MGTQGEIYAVYGAVVEASVGYQPGKDQNPVIYLINGHGVCDDEDGAVSVLDKLAFEVDAYNGITSYYGESDLKDPKLCVRVLGHTSSMGSRHFDGKALVGYVVCNESYMASASPCPPMDKIKALGKRLVDEIREKLGLDIDTNELRLHLMFDWLQGF